MLRAVASALALVPAARERVSWSASCEDWSLPVCKGQVVRRVLGRSVRLKCSPGTGKGGEDIPGEAGQGVGTSPEAYALHSETPGGRTAVGPEGGNMKGHPSLEPPLPLLQCLGI